MGILALTADERVAGVKFTKDTLSVSLRDGRTIIVPLVWYPRLLKASLAERKNWRVAGGGYGIHWPDIDEDLSTEGLLRVRRPRDRPRSEMLTTPHAAQPNAAPDRRPRGCRSGHADRGRQTAMTSTVRQELLGVLTELSKVCLEMRFGQLIANLATLARGLSAEGLWDAEDEELLAAARKQLSYFAASRSTVPTR